MSLKHCLLEFVLRNKEICSNIPMIRKQKPSTTSDADNRVFPPPQCLRHPSIARVVVQCVAEWLGALPKASNATEQAGKQCKKHTNQHIGPHVHTDKRTNYQDSQTNWHVHTGKPHTDKQTLLFSQQPMRILSEPEPSNKQTNKSKQASNQNIHAGQPVHQVTSKPFNQLTR